MRKTTRCKKDCNKMRLKVRETEKVRSGLADLIKEGKISNGYCNTLGNRKVWVLDSERVIICFTTLGNRCFKVQRLSLRSFIVHNVHYVGERG